MYRKENMEKYEEEINKSNLSEKDRADFKAFNLGLVGEYREYGCGHHSYSHFTSFNIKDVQQLMCTSR